MSSSVRVRYAPSPTGDLHVGNARTALFNWLFARHHKGTFILRIEDTDKERSTERSTAVILDSLKWLGIDWDEGPEVGGSHAPYFQSQRLDIYRDFARKLVESRHAYHCFCTKEELDTEREQAMKKKHAPRYSGKCRNLTGEEAAAKLSQGLPASVRFRVPEGATSFDDAVRGTVTFQHQEIGDFIVMRSDGTPVYNFSAAVDDGLMEITHVIRGEDGISNTPRQILILQALGFNVPRYAHLPLVNGPDGSKLSKRHGETSVLSFRDMGVLPEAMVNFLALIGWSPGDDREILSREELIQLFSLEGIGKAAGIFNYKKLQWMNGEYIRALPVTELANRFEPILQNAGLLPKEVTAAQREWLVKLAAATRDRLPYLREIVGYSDFFFKKVESYEEKGVKKYFGHDGALHVLEEMTRLLASVEPFKPTVLEESCKTLAEQLGVPLGHLIHPTRLALTGKTVGPGLYETMELLGREKCLERMRRAVEFVQQQRHKAEATR